MSTLGHEQKSPVNLPSNTQLTSSLAGGNGTQNAHTQTLPQGDEENNRDFNRIQKYDDYTLAECTDLRTTIPTRFAEYVEHRRTQTHLNNRQRSLYNQKRILQKSITLSARLHRLSSWVRDGLVEISKHSDAAGFVRAHQHMQDLVDLSYSQWNNELHALDPLESTDLSKTSTASHASFLTKLTHSARVDLLALVSCLRSDSRFLIERFKALLPAQIIALSTFPRFEDRPEPALSSTTGRTRFSQRKIKTFSKQLEDYASSFERSNPLSFLLFNIYGTSRSLSARENQLRLSTWSTVCADLILTNDHAYQALLPQLSSSFASLHEWRARDAVELFLMDVLQRGAFLLDLANTGKTFVMGDHSYVHTPQAQEFFDSAVLELFAIFATGDGGFPVGSLQFASAVVSKLPPQQQSQFRGEFFSNWFLDRFLRIIITYPENENMLLKFHISRDAREHILLPLWREIDARIADVYSPSPIRPVHPDFRDYVIRVINVLDAMPVQDPYLNAELHRDENEQPEATITICASEVVQVLDAMSPQVINGMGTFGDNFLRSSTTAFQIQYSHLSDKFDRLRKDLRELIEPGSFASNIHPCQEQWLQLEIDVKGQPREAGSRIEDSTSDQHGEHDQLDIAQQSIFRLYNEQVLGVASDASTTYRTGLIPHQSLTSIFRDMIVATRARNDPLARRYWERALRSMHEKYPMSRWEQDDTAILRKLYEKSKEVQVRSAANCIQLELEVSLLEGVLSKIQATVTCFVDRFEELKLKLWYTVDVITSKFYEDAKNITDALNNMALSVLKSTVQRSSEIPASRRPLSIRSTTSSLFEQSIQEAMRILKAPPEHGGPKKLADVQIETTKKWLQRSNVDNFCRGEERIHRFCMEVVNVSKKLVGESLSDSPVLWSSELFARERSFYDIHTFGITSAPASTRPASIMSDGFASSLRSSRPIFRSNDSARMALVEDRRSPVRRISLHNSGSTRIPRDFLVPELASSIGSPGIAYSATTAESISSIWSPLPSNTRSHTSASSYSRPASMFNDHSLNRFADTAREKSKFLEKAQRTLVCLLLSDLGCPVWSLGTETDAWLNTIRDDDPINTRLKHRTMTEVLVGRQAGNVLNNSQSKVRKSCRSTSVPARSKPHANIEMRDSFTMREDEENFTATMQYESLLIEDLEDLLAKLSQQVDPIEKLQIVEEFHSLSLTQLQPESTTRETEHQKQIQHRWSSLDHRRHSLHCHDLATRDDEVSNLPGASSDTTVSEQKIVRQLKLDLITLKPRTLFRDLQYISAFVPCELTDKTPRGRAFLHLGLAALAYKDEVCRSMVDVADTIVARDAIKNMKRTSMAEPSITKAIEYWMLGAREGNAVAQRELALLYLSHPEYVPIITPPLVVSSGIFKSDMLWREQDMTNPSMSALCLALHWMQRAADSGDRVAQQKLEERKVKHSIR